MEGVAEDLKRDLLASSIQFPRTKSFSEDTPYWQEEVEELTLSTYKQLAEKLQNNTEMIAMSAREDVSQMLDV